jgi:polysaccharide export outer membrane protein
MTAIVLLLTLVSWQTPSPPVPSTPPADAFTDYVVGPQDALNVIIFGEDTLSKKVTVDGDGTFDYPLIGRVQGSGQTVRKIQDEIRRKLIAGGFLLNPTVTIEIAAYRSQTVYVQGAVRMQGAVQMSGNTSLMYAIAQAGFTTKSGSKITISHRPDGNGPAPAPVTIDRKDLESGRAQNIRLQDGDVVTVSEAERFFITGEVKAPGQFDYDPELTIQQALILAGGGTDKARLSGIRVDRIVDGKSVQLKVKITDRFQPNDTIVVPRKFF